MGSYSMTHVQSMEIIATTLLQPSIAFYMETRHVKLCIQPYRCVYDLSYVDDATQSKQYLPCCNSIEPNCNSRQMMIEAKLGFDQKSKTYAFHVISILSKKVTVTPINECIIICVCHVIVLHVHAHFLSYLFYVGHTHLRITEYTTEAWQAVLVQRGK